MKRLFFTAGLITMAASSVRAQTIFYDKKDAFTDTRKMVTSLNALCKAGFTSILSVCSELHVKGDSIVDYRLDFAAPNMQTQNNNKEVQANTCLLRDESGAIYTGALQNESSGVVVQKAYQTYTCSFSPEDFYKLQTANVTDVKITTDLGNGGTYSINKNLQDNIAKQATTLLKRLKGI